MDYRTGNVSYSKKTDVLRAERTWHLREEKVARQLSDIFMHLKIKNNFIANKLKYVLIHVTQTTFFFQKLIDYVFARYTKKFLIYFESNDC